MASDPKRLGAKFAAHTDVEFRATYQARIFGPMLDRIDLQIEVPAVSAADLVLPQASEGSAEVRAVSPEHAASRPSATTNAECDGTMLEEIAAPETAGLTLCAMQPTRSR